MSTSEVLKGHAFVPDLVSVVTPVFNSVRFIGETMDSVYHQTYSRWEHIIVDDGSTDGTSELIADRAKCDQRIRHLRLPGRSGPANARNVAFKAAQGQYIAFVDADDLWLPTKLERQVTFMKRSGAGLSYTGFRRITMDGNAQGRQIQVPARVSYSDLLKHNPIGCLTVLLDREKTGPIEMRDDINEDLTLWLQLLRRGVVEARGIDEDLARYRVVDKSRSSNKLAAATWRWHVYRDIERLPLAPSIYYFFCYAARTLIKHSRF